MRHCTTVQVERDSEDVEQTIDVFMGGGLCGGKEEVQQEKVEQHAD